jgi:tRNA(Ile)-lysidine synthase TilS/MesJ
MKYFKAESNGTTNTRSSANNEYTFACIYRNISESNPGVGASFHKTLEAAEKTFKAYGKYSHLEMIEIIPTVEITKQEFQQLKVA